MRKSFAFAETARFLIAVVPLTLFVGLIRTWMRFQDGILPNQYLAQSAVLNMALCLLFAAATAPFVLALSVLWKSERRRSWILLAAFSFTYLLFWGFNTAIGFRVLREFVAGTTEPVISEVVYWLPGMIAFVVAGFVLTRADGRKTLRRAALVGVAGLVLVGAMRYYALKTDPSLSSPLTLEASAQRKPHVFLVLVDTLRADHLGAYGYDKPTSPAVDALAADSTVFDRTFAPAPWTRPSCGSLLTSRYPPEIGLDGMFKPLPSEIPILPQYLSNEGYRTAGVVSSVHLSAQFGFDKGWDLLDIGTTYLQWTGTKMAYSRLGLVAWGETYPRYDARELTDRAIDWLDDALDDGPEPVFMYLHYSDPHAPYRPPEEFDRWREFAAPEVVEAIDEPPFSPTWANRTLSQLEVAAMVARYDAEIAYFDREFQRLLEHLRATGIYDRSLIVLTSDHGEEFGEHGGWAHAHTLYNELLHVPMVVKYPEHLERPKGRRVEATTSLVDVVPTVRDVLAADWPQNLFRGRSLLRTDLGADDYAVYAKADGHGLRSVMAGDDKLIQKTDRSGELQTESYFSLRDDFAELQNGEVPGDLDPERLEMLRTVAHGIDSLTFTGSEEISLDQETLRELKALGYID